ncbi:MarC family protein [Desulfobacterota bacterium AH_259_B03_O07]|nr:MarC family protein [Desulfobacterota bacterium AH_259_B03_O07]
MITSLILSFIPLFVAIDPIGITPMYLSLTRELNHEERKRVARDSIMTACAIGIIFVFAGRFIFKILGITFADFAIAGGLLLFSLSILDLLREENPEIKKKPSTSLGIFPMGTPLIVGPAVLTTLIVLVDTQGFIATLIAFGMNLLILGVVLLKADILLSFLGESGARAFAKVMSILLAAIGIMMVRRGIMELISGNV